MPRDRDGAALLDLADAARSRPQREGGNSVVETGSVLAPHAADLAAFCRRWRISEVALFGSALREDFRPDSDVDLLVTFEEGAPWGLFDIVHMKDELADILGRPVDLIERRAIEKSKNWIRRREILGTARTIYAVG